MKSFSKTHKIQDMDDLFQFAKISWKFKAVVKNTSDVMFLVNASLDFFNIIANLFFCLT